MATEKKAFVLRINPDTLKELERWAQDEFRSVNGQIEYILSEALRKRKSRPNSGANSASSRDEESD
ncbi:Arc family DNA-binding protein [Rudanella paleaurantiibacter]|uniref:Arc family DNA-binding protein n=1 Tax=Rudanella paleaurantiibacter TaxID=2614655 RepID=A0A7J5TTM2_9BACT|nr:Arc family DNA-binding protein [Rudanella paleaurantiibacter]KAB7727036.1 Arc family DNA-binding protein [Rudanella paleaurantiibacter]